MQDDCGSMKGYRNHFALGTEYCQGCRTAMADYQREYRDRIRRGEDTSRKVAKCGSVSGYKRHKARKEEVCAQCRESIAAYHRERRAQLKAALSA